jgi:hypothetical protein
MTLRGAARQNLQVTAVNTALERKLIALDCTPVADAMFEFELAGLPVVATVHDAGFDEVSVRIIVAPTELGRKLVGSALVRWHPAIGGAHAFCWLERRTGKYLQTGGYNGTRAITRALSELIVVPHGFGTKPTRDGYDFHKECEAVFGKPVEDERIEMAP